MISSSKGLLCREPITLHLGLFDNPEKRLDVFSFGGQTVNCLGRHRINWATSRSKGPLWTIETGAKPGCRPPHSPRNRAGSSQTETKNQEIKLKPPPPQKKKKHTHTHTTKKEHSNKREEKKLPACSSAEDWGKPKADKQKSAAFCSRMVGCTSVDPVSLLRRKGKNAGSAPEPWMRWLGGGGGLVVCLDLLGFAYYYYYYFAWICLDLVAWWLGGLVAWLLDETF